MTSDRVVVTAFVHSLIEAERSRTPPATFREIGKMLGCSGPNAKNIFDHRTGVGPTLQQSLADKRFGGSIDRLRAAARDWWRAGGEQSVSGAGTLAHAHLPTADYPSLAELLAEAPGAYPDDVVAILRGFRFLRGDPGKDWFRRRLRDLTRAMADALEELPPGARA